MLFDEHPTHYLDGRLEEVMEYLEKYDEQQNNNKEVFNQTMPLNLKNNKSLEEVQTFSKVYIYTVYINTNRL